jgi:hypothetical protein
VPSGEVVIVVTGTAEFRRLARELKAAGDGRLARQMRTGMRKAAEPMLRAARSNVATLHSAGSRGGGTADRAAFTAGRSRRLTESVQRRVMHHSGLRAAVARATRVETSTGRNPGVRLRTNIGQMPANQRKLPVHLNTGRWRHPVHGNREVWVTQTAAPRGWFSRATKDHGPKVRNAAVEVVTATIAQLAK